MLQCNEACVDSDESDWSDGPPERIEINDVKSTINFSDKKTK